mmetsp:Transcript_20030/g.40122  ORF Transcript_20030/g.40122 Transcript_20030/m.40122 type:complete len:233 (+) Transcript_20030:461-1159(+)
MTAGSFRGKEAAPQSSLIHTEQCPPWVIFVAEPHFGQNFEFLCHVIMPVAQSDTWFSVKSKKGACVRVSAKPSSSAADVDASKAKRGRPLAKPRKAPVVESTGFSLNCWASARGKRASSVSERKSILGPAMTTKRASSDFASSARASASVRSSTRRSRPSLRVIAFSSSRPAVLANSSIFFTLSAWEESTMALCNMSTTPCSLRAATAMAEKPVVRPLGRKDDPAAPPSAIA